MPNTTGGRFVTPDIQVLIDLIKFLNLDIVLVDLGNTWSLNGEPYPTADAACDALGTLLVEKILEPGNVGLTCVKTQWVCVTVAGQGGQFFGRGSHLADACLRALVSGNV